MSSPAPVDPLGHDLEIPKTHPLKPSIFVAIELAGPLFLVYAGLVMAPLVGVQTDEALFAAPLLSPKSAAAWVFDQVPIMQMTYLGSLKTWLYAPVFEVFGTGVYSLRVPTILLSAGAILLWTFWLRQVGGRTIAAVFVLLVATDPVYIMTSTFDWGPVVLQRLLFVAGVVLIWRYHKTGMTRYLFAAGVVFGLGLWDKALFIWVLSAACVMTLLVWRRAVVAALTGKACVIGAVALCIGAGPLIYYNVNAPANTFTSNINLSSEGLLGKLYVARSTLEGQSLFGLIVRDGVSEDAEVERQFGRLNRWTATVTRDDGHRTLLFWALTATVPALPLLWSTRFWGLAVWSLCVMAIAFAEMALNQGTGHGAQHISLLWPLPHVAIGCAIAALIDRRSRPVSYAGIVVLGCLVLSNCLVVNQYYRHAKAVGTAPTWTDAVFALAEAPAIQHAPVYVMDWGIMDSLRLLGEGDLDLRVGWERFTQDGGEQAAAKWVLDPRQAESHNRFIFRVAEQEVFRGVSDRFQRALSAGNVNRVKEAVISDRHGRPTFEIWRLIPPS